jgi:hypothetical protein
MGLASASFGQMRDRDKDFDSLSKQVESLQEQLAEIHAKREEEELTKLRQSAETEAVAAPDASESLEERSYITASRSLQMLNPEISVSGDFLAKAILNQDMLAVAGDRSGFQIRALDMHIQSSLDPFSHTKIALGFTPPNGFLLEELFMTWTGLIPQVSFTVGHFRQQFGVVNRWHQHDLEQTDYPMVISELLGVDEYNTIGLGQTGLSLTWHMPSLWADANELTLQVTNGSNPHLYAGDFFSIPAVLVHLKNYYDLSENTYLELGFSGQLGWNNRRGFLGPNNTSKLKNEDWRPTFVGGADLTVHWQPLKQARYNSITWRFEFMWVSKETETVRLNGWGAYSYLQYQLGASAFVGLRGDLVAPLSLWDELCWKVVPYLTYWQSEFVYLRLEAQHGEIPGMGHDTRFVLQLNWAAGPHKHEKY